MTDKEEGGRKEGREEGRKEGVDLFLKSNDPTPEGGDKDKTKTNTIWSRIPRSGFGNPVKKLALETTR